MSTTINIDWKFVSALCSGIAVIIVATKLSSDVAESVLLSLVDSKRLLQ